jgi:hypothetical protein
MRKKQNTTMQTKLTPMDKQWLAAHQLRMPTVKDEVRWAEVMADFWPGGPDERFCR